MSQKKPISFIFAAGKSSRMGMSVPKILLPLGGQRVIDYVLSCARSISDADIVLVISKETQDIVWPQDVYTVIQEEPKGTGDAFKTAFLEAEKRFPDLLDRDIVVLLGDAPLIKEKDLTEILSCKAPFALMGMYPKEPGAYGRMLQKEGHIVDLIEAKNLEKEQLDLSLCYTGVMRIQASLSGALSSKIQPNALTKEYYVTDFVPIAAKEGLDIPFFVGDENIFCGMNTRQEWIAVEANLQNQFRMRAIEQGALLFDPLSTFFSFDTVVSKGVMIYPQNFFGPGVRLEEDVTIFPFCVLKECHIQKGSSVGPFAHLRNKAILEASTHIGNFVEVKNSHIGAYSQAKHLSYIGDAIVGEHVNIGACVVTCNFDGFQKNQTTIKDKVFVGSHSSLIAPVCIKEQSIVAAGSVITQDVPEKSLALSRGKQINKALDPQSKYLNRQFKE